MYLDYFWMTTSSNERKPPQHDFSILMEQTGRGLVEFELTAGAFLWYYDYYQDSLVTVQDAVKAVTNYEYEEEQENKKRNIFILKERYLGIVLDDMQDIMPYKNGSTQYVSRTIKRGENIRLY